MNEEKALHGIDIFSLTKMVRVEIICPMCVRTIAKYLVPKGEPIELGPVTQCPYCDGGER